METRVIVDASVLVAAVSPSERGHADALAFLQLAHASHALFFEPPQFLLELYAVLTRQPRQLRQLGFMTETDPIVMQWTPIAEPEIQRLLAWLTSTCPGRCPTRGADLVYVAAARETGLPLVTLDAGLQIFGEYGLAVYAPSEFHFGV